MNPLVEIIREDAAAVLSNVDFSSVEGKEILITGASGLIGTHLVSSLDEAIAKKGLQLSLTITMQSTPPHFLLPFIRASHIRILRGDLTDYVFRKSLADYDVIVHAAGYGQPGRFMENPVKTLQLNSTTTAELFDHLKPEGRFLFVSTSEVYSGLERSPYRETDIGTTNTDHPRACYIEAKRCGEAIVHAYRAKGVQAKSARLALAYGPGTRPHDKRVLNSFIEKGCEGEIALLDLGKARRTYCYVSDAVEMLWRIALEGKEGLYNVAGISHTTIAELALKIGEVLGVPVTFPSKNEEMVGAPEEVSLDLSKIQKEFNKTKFVGLHEGLLKTTLWQQALYKQLRSPLYETQRRVS